MRQDKNACHSAVGNSGPLLSMAYRTGLEDWFWASYMPNGQLLSPFNKTQAQLGGSLSVLRDLLPDSPLLRRAVVATAFRAMGNSQNAPKWMKEEGIKLHVTSLQQMSKTLARQRYGLEALGVARLFSFHQVCSHEGCPQDSTEDNEYD